jgi:hypothetical protein
MSEIVTKRSFFMAEEAGVYDQYRQTKPSEQLKTILLAEMGKISKAQAVRRLPEKMAALSFENTKGQAEVVKMTPADYFTPGSGVGGVTVPGKGLVPILVVDTIMEGASPHVSARDTVPVLNMGSEVESYPFFSARSYVSPSAPGSDAYELMQLVGHATMKALRYTLKASIGKELIKDAKVDIIAAILKEAGATMELTINRQVYSRLLEFNSGTNITGQTTIKSGAAIVAAKAQVDQAGFRADTAVVWPVLWSSLLSDIIPAYNIIAEAKATQDAPEALSKIMYGGVKVYETGIALDAAESSKTIGYSSSSTYAGMVFDKSHIGYLGIREDLVAEQFDDVMKYMEVPVLTSRFDFRAATDENDSTVTNKTANACIVHS